MRNFLLGAVGILSVASAMPTFAADMAARPYTKAPAPVVAAAYDWSGFYIGLNGGGGSSSKCWDLTNNLGVAVVPTLFEGCHDATGGTVGGQVGYRFQSQAWVFGIEAQGNWADFSGSGPNAVFFVTDHSKIDSFGMFTGQIGYSINSLLLYAKGGAAVVHDKYSTVSTFAGSVGLTADTASETRWGGVVGVGAEYGFAQNWSVAFEYDPHVHGYPRCERLWRRKHYPSGRSILGYGSNSSGCRSRHCPIELPLGWTDRRPILIF